MKLLFTAFLSWVVSCGVSAADLERERRIAQEIEDAIVVGDPVWLQTGDTSFLGIHTEASTDVPVGGVIVLHGRGAHPDWVDVVQPLRSELPDAGWESLSLQMPVAAADAGDQAYVSLVPEAFPRIVAGIAYFKARKITNIVLIGHSLGSAMAVAFMAAEPAEEIIGLVAVGLSVHQRNPEAGILKALSKVEIPMLDIYGSRDLEAVTTTVRDRAVAAKKAGNQGYQQLEIEGADHFFRGVEDALVARVRAWLKKLQSGLAEAKGASRPE